MDRIEPAEPMERIEPAEPIERIDPLDPMLRIEPAEPAGPDELAEPEDLLHDEPRLVCMTAFSQQEPGGGRTRPSA
jgi:hypothetical protein